MSTRILVPFFALLAAASLLRADTITFTNGAVIRGTFLGGDARTIRIEVNNQVQTYRISEVASILFGDGAAPGVGAAGVGAAAGAAMQAAQVQAPVVQAPAVQAPAVQAPQVQAPQVQAPQVQAPQVQAPQVQAPQVQAPQVQAPAPKRGLFGRKKGEPQVQSPQVQAPQIQAPQVQAPQVQAPQVQAPQVQAPQVQALPMPVSAAAPPQPVAAPEPVPQAAPAQAAVAPAGSAPSAAAVAPPAAVAAPAPLAAAATPAPVVPAQTVPIGGADGRTIPVGALLRVRLIDTIDSSVHQPGETFRGSLEAELAAAGDTLLAKGTDVIVRLAQVPSSGADARPMFRLESTAIRLRGGNLAVAAEGLPASDPSFVAPAGAGLAKLVVASDGMVTLRVTRAFRVP